MKKRVAVVTGASRGVGRGIAAELASHGAIVYGTGRSIDAADLPGEVQRLQCDHSNDDDVRNVFSRVQNEQGRLDILVNSVWGGYENMVEAGVFTWPAPFWQQPLWRWQAMMDTGVRALFVASQEAARLMIPARSGLIVNLSYWSAQKHLGNAIYGAAKAATDKLTSDMAAELHEHRVAVVSLYPGLVRTEAVLAAADAMDLSNSESPEYIGRAVWALVEHPGLMGRTGQVLVAATLGQELGFSDTDGSTPRPLRLAEA